MLHDGAVLGLAVTSCAAGAGMSCDESSCRPALEVVASKVSTGPSFRVMLHCYWQTVVARCRLITGARASGGDITKLASIRRQHNRASPPS